MLKNLLATTALCSLILGTSSSLAQQNSINGMGDLGQDLDQQQQVFETKTSTLAARLEAEMADTEEKTRAISAIEQQLKSASKRDRLTQQALKSELTEAVAVQLAATYKVVSTYHEILGVAYDNLDAVGTRMRSRRNTEDTAKLSQDLQAYTNKAKQQAEALEKVTLEFERSPDSGTTKALLAAMKTTFTRVYNERESLARRLKNGKNMDALVGKIMHDKSIVAQAAIQTGELKRSIEIAAERLKDTIEYNKASTTIGVMTNAAGGAGKGISTVTSWFDGVSRLIYGDFLDNDSPSSDLEHDILQASSSYGLQEKLNAVKSW